MDLRAREGDFLETKEGLIFDVKGLKHPSDRIIAFLRYYPDINGPRFRDGNRYEKVYSLTQRYTFLEKNYPQYLFHDRISNELLQGVPNENIKKIYRPEEFLRGMLQNKITQERTSLSSVSEKSLEMAKWVHLQSGVSFDKIGISGSVLVNLETESSDIDLIIYGSKDARKVYASLSKIHESPSELIHPYSEQEIGNLYELRGKESNLSFQEFVKIEGRKKLQGIFKGIDYYIRCIKDRNEVKYNYEEIQYKSVGQGTVSGVITEDKEAIFTPCKYLIDIAKTEGINIPEKIQEIASFRGRFCEQTRKGESFEAYGKVELVKSRRESYYRLLIGANREDFFRVLNL